MEIATILLIVSCVAAGVVSAVVTTWSLRAKLLGFEDRLSLVEGILTREVKSRAGQERWKKPDKDLELARAMVQQPVQRKMNWWETGLPRSAQ